MAWIEPKTDRVAGSRTTYEDLNRICNNLLEKGFLLTKSVYDYGDFVTASEWAEIVNAAKRGDSTVTDSTLYSNLNKLEAAIINAEPDLPLYFTALESTNIAFTKSGEAPTPPTLQYKINNGSWTNYTFGNSISLTANDKCYFKGDNDYFSGPGRSVTFSSTGRVSANGNIMSLLDSTLQLTTISGEFCFSRLFKDCTNLVSAPELPATILSKGCYVNMFENCSITAAPSLPATSIPDYAYEEMFDSCTSLTTVPDLSHVQSNEYGTSTIWMFRDCSSLVANISSSQAAPYRWGIGGNNTHNGMLRDTIGTYSSIYHGDVRPPATAYTQNEPV